MGMLVVTVITAQPEKAVINKESANNTTYQDVSGYNGPCKCGNPMSSDDFKTLLTDIKANGTDSKMLRFAKLEIRDKCLLASQVEEIMLLFMFDINRTDFVKFAKTYTYDLANYSALRIKYPVYLTSQDYGQLYNPTEFKKNQYPGTYVNELNKNYIPNGRLVEIERDNYYRAGSPPE